MDSCIQLVVDNWFQFPSILLQKAWVRTRHVSLEEMKAMNGSTDDDFAQSEQWCDPSGLAGVLGYEGASAPNADDMELNQVDRKVLLWEIKNPDTDQWALLPASLVFSLEKRLANYVHQVAQKQPMPVWASVCWNTRLAKEASPSWVAQNTVHSPGGKRHFSDKISKKASKELVLLHFQCDKLQLVVGDEGKVRQLNYVMLNPDSVDPSISTFSVADVHKQFAGATPGTMDAPSEHEASSEGDPEDDGDEMHNMMVAFSSVQGQGHFMDQVDDASVASHDSFAQDLAGLMEVEYPGFFDSNSELFADFNIGIGEEDLEQAASASSIDKPAAVCKAASKPGDFTTSERAKLILPPVVGCRLQHRAPHGCVQVWYPNMASRTFRYASAGVYTPDTAPAGLVHNTIRSAGEWAWKCFAVEHGQESAERMHKMHVAAFEHADA